MTNDTQRMLLWAVFGLSAVMLWDRWQIFNGGQGFFGDMQADKQPVKQEKVVKDAPKPASVPAAASSMTIPAAKASAAKQPAVVVETDLLRMSIDPEGAVLSRAELLKQSEDRDWKEDGLVGKVLGKTHSKPQNKVLLEPSNHKYLAQSGLIGGAFPTHKTPYRLVSQNLKLADGAKSLDVRFESEAGGVKVAKTYTLTRGSYTIGVKHEIENKTSGQINPSVYYQLQRDGEKPDNQNSMYYTYTGTALYDKDDKFTKVSYEDIQKDKKSYKANVDNGWVAMIEHYFLTAWIPEDGAKRENYTRALSKNLNAIGTIVPTGTIDPGKTVTQQAKFYVGPQDQEVLSKLSTGLDLVVDYGWLTFLAKPIYWLLSFLHGIVGNWGWAIVLLTCIVKAVLYPLSLAGYRSMAKMKDLGPKMNQLKEMYGDDKQKLNQAMMEFYKKEKINPVGGCLPIMLQMPVFIALYWVLLASVELRGAPWILWVQDLASPDVWFILPAIMMVTMFLQFKLNPTPPDPTQAKMMMIMPLVFGVMFFFFASGLVLYWLINNILSIAQQWAVNKQIANDRIRQKQAAQAKG